MRNPLSAARSFTLAALAALATATCTDQPTEPGAGYAARVRFAPTFVSGSSAAGLPLDNVTVTVVRPAAETLLVQNAPFALDDSVLQLDLAVDLLAPSEELEVTLELRSGVSTLFRGSDLILVTGDAGGTTPSIPLNYVGPGANIAWITIAPRDSVLSFGDTLTFGATAFDSLEAGVANFYLSWSTGSAAAAIRADGRVIAPNVRAKVWIHAVTPTGIEDSTAITFIPVPTQVQKQSGDLQGGLAGDTLALPVTVQVMASDDLPVKGVAVTFAALTGGGAVLDTVVATDSLGRAGARVVLGTGLGANTFTATVAGLTPVTFTATAGAGAPSAIAKTGGDAQADTAGRTLPLPLQVHVTDDNGNPVAGVAVVWTTVAGSGVPAADTVLTAADGDAEVGYTLGGPGIDSIRATIAGTGAFVTFTAAAAAGEIDVVTISGDAQADTVARLLDDSLVVETRSAVNGAPVSGVMVHWTVSTGDATVSADSALSDLAGRAAVQVALGTTTGAVQVTADAQRGGAPGVFNATAKADAPHHLAYIVTPPDTLVAGTLVTPAPVIEVRDSFDNAAPVAGIQVYAYTDGMIAASPPAMSAPTGLQFSAYLEGGTTVPTDSTGRATFDSLVIGGSVGDETLRFEENDLGLGQISTPIYLKAGAPSSVLGILGDAQTAYVDSLVVVAPRVIVTDSFGNVLEGVAVDWVVAAGGGQVTGANTVTDSLGEAEVGSWRMGSAPGSNALRAVVAGVDSAVFHATAIPLTPTIQLTLLGTNVVGVGRTATLQVQLSSPAVGIVTVSVVSNSPSIVDVTPPSASIPDGSSTGFTTLSGITAGTAEIVAFAAGYEPDTLVVTGSLNLITLPTTQNVPFGQTASLPVQLALPAPAGGVVVTLTSLDPTKVSLVTPTVTFNAGEQLKNATISGTALGSSQIVAENPNFAPDTTDATTSAQLNITVASATQFNGLPQPLTVELRSGGTPIAAPAGGIPVTLTARNPACLAPATGISIPQGQTSTTFTVVYGGSAGLPCTSYVDATATGIDPDSVNFTLNATPTATMSNTVVGSGLQVSQSLSLQTGTHGGVTAKIRSLSPGTALIAPNGSTPGTDSILIPISNGTTSASFYVQGVEGHVEDTVLAVLEVTGFQPDTALVVVRRPAYEIAGVNASATSLTVDDDIYVQMGLPNLAGTAIIDYQSLRAGGTPVVGIFTIVPSAVATLKDSAGAVDTVRTAVIPVGRYYSSTNRTANPGGVAVDYLTPGAATVSVNIPGLTPLIVSRPITVTGPTSALSNLVVGSGLVSSSGSVSLGASAHGGVTAKLRVLQPGVATLSLNNTTVGTDSIQQFIPDGGTSFAWYAHGMEGILEDTVQVELTVPGFTPDTAIVVVRRPAYEIAGVNASADSLAIDDDIYVQLGLPNLAGTSIIDYQSIRPGGTPVVGTFTLVPAGIATLKDSLGATDTVRTALIPVGRYYSSTTRTGNPGGVAIDYLAVGSGSVTVNIPGLLPLVVSRPISVTPSAVTLNTGSVVGSGMQVAESFSLSAGQHGGVTATLRTLTPGLVLLAPNTTTLGSDSIDFAVANNTTSVSWYAQALEGFTNDSVAVVVSIPGFVPDTSWVRVRGVGVELASVATSRTTLDANDDFYAQMGVLNTAGTSIVDYQNRRFGGTGWTVRFTSANAAVARLVDTTGPVDTAFVAIPFGQYYTPTTLATGGVTLDPLTTGTTVITASAPGVTSLPGASAVVTVSAPGITVSAPNVGSGLQSNGTFTLGAAQHGGRSVVVKSSAPGLVLVSPNATTPGTDSIILNLPNGTTGGSFYVQGMDGVNGSPTIQVTTDGFQDGSDALDVLQPAIELTSVTTNPSAAAANDEFYAQVGIPNGIHTSIIDYQNRRAGAAPFTVTFTTSAGAISTLVTTAGSATTRTADIVPGFYYTPTTVATGGVAHDPLAPGLTVISAALSGFITLPGATVSVNIGP
jgi:hypothetical protein